MLGEGEEKEQQNKGHEKLSVRFTCYINKLLKS